MAKTVNLYQAKTQLSKLVDEASAGQEIIIAKAGKPKARLVPLEKVQPQRKPGALKGQIWIADDFDDDLPPEILVGFLGEDETDNHA
ncbi:MAG: type II toxin-antitoxin system Phd/YefM family antitoxin [Gemmatimonadetes bacterium]|nr:type II toxin-antitoxin system Phd/YefM family antitoxin [Gemmatimonadota bacterium]